MCKLERLSKHIIYTAVSSIVHLVNKFSCSCAVFYWHGNEFGPKLVGLGDYVIRVGSANSIYLLDIRILFLVLGVISHWAILLCSTLGSEAPADGPSVT
jgi:hypothetical protein